MVRLNMGLCAEEVEMPKTYQRVRNHIVSGFLFIMPVLICLAVISRFWKHLLRVGGLLSRGLRIDTALGPSGDAVMAVVFFLLVCGVAGFLVHISFVKRFGDRIDERLGRFVPGYTQLRSEARKKVGVEKGQEPPRFEACLVRVHELWEPGYIVELNLDGTETVFVPQAPAGSYGHVYVVHPSQLRKLGIDSVELNAHLKDFGKGIVTAHAHPGPQ
jgi:uncharacterized membrane protein